MCGFLSFERDHNNHYHLPRIDYLLDQLNDVVYLAKLDLISGYHQKMIVKGDIWKTTFKTKQGLFEQLVLCGKFTSVNKNGLPRSSGMIWKQQRKKYLCFSQIDQNMENIPTWNMQ